MLAMGHFATIATDGTFLDVAVTGDFLAKLQSGQESPGPAIHLSSTVRRAVVASLTVAAIGVIAY